MSYTLQRHGYGILVYVVQGSIACYQYVAQTGDTLFIEEGNHVTMQAIDDTVLVLMETPMG